MIVKQEKSWFVLLAFALCMGVVSRAEAAPWIRHTIDSASRGADLDILTCEERAGLGVIWYENPARSGAAP